METYLFKIVLCSSIFIAFYYLFLRNEKVLKFNRFYLIVSLLFSLVFPLLHYNSPSSELSESSGLIVGNLVSVGNDSVANLSFFTISNFLIAIYIIGTAYRLIKFSRGLWKMRQLIKTSDVEKLNAHLLVLTEDKNSAHSFWNSIFLDKNDFKSGKIDDKILLHECAHLDQKHSADILLIEIVLIFFWFNPAFYLYKKYMLINHEFLADSEVLKNSRSISEYQKLLLRELTAEKRQFTNSFNLINTKKRIKMMTKKTTKLAKLKSSLSVPLAVALFLTFAQKISATENPTDNSDITIFPSAISSRENFATSNNIIKSDTLKPQKKIKNQKAGDNPPPPPPPPKAVSVELKEGDKVNYKMPPPPPPSSSVKQIPAEFPGGPNSFRNSVANIFDGSVFSGNEGVLKATVYIKIDESGRVTDYYTADGGNEVFNKENLTAVKKANEGKLWKPATENGKAVMSIYSMPMTMVFESPKERK